MNKVLSEVTGLLNDYSPKEALIRLSGLQNMTEQSYRLKEECKKLLRQQLLYLLREAKETNDYDEMERLLKDYTNFLGKDRHYKLYYKEILLERERERENEIEEKNRKLLEEKKKQEEIDRAFNRGLIILLLVIGIIVVIIAGYLI